MDPVNKILGKDVKYVVVWQEGDKSVDEVHPGWFAAKYKDSFVKEDGVVEPWRNIEFAKKQASRAEEKDISDKEHKRFKYRLKKYGLEED